jgi:hypothetical protein
MNKLPGMQTLTRPVSNLMQKTPGMRGAPAALGMMQQNKGIGPSMPPPQMGAVAGQMMPQQGLPQEMGGDQVPGGDMSNQVESAYGQPSPMPPVPMGNRLGSQNFGGANQGAMGGFAGRMGQAMGNRFGGGGMKPQGQPMNKMGRTGGFKPQY